MGELKQPKAVQNPLSKLSKPKPVDGEAKHARKMHLGTVKPLFKSK